MSKGHNRSITGNYTVKKSYIEGSVTIERVGIVSEKLAILLAILGNLLRGGITIMSWLFCSSALCLSCLIDTFVFSWASIKIGKHTMMVMQWVVDVYAQARWMSSRATTPRHVVNIFPCFVLTIKRKPLFVISWPAVRVWEWGYYLNYLPRYVQLSKR